MDFFQIYFYKYRYLFIFIILFIFYFYFYFNSCFFDSFYVYEYNPKILANKEIWKHVYGSIGSFITPITLYNNKCNCDTFFELRSYLSVLHSLLENFILNSNTSEFYKSPTDFPEVNSIYQNYMNNMVNLQNQIKNFRIVVQKNDFEVHIFENLVKNTTHKYINYIESAIKILELDTNSSDPQIQQLIQQLQNLLNELNKLIIK